MPFFRVFSFPDNESNGKTERKSIRTENGRTRIADIAEELGLSTAAVSNVIHGKTKKTNLFLHR